jgi:3',5'-cyclic AMP phosphodiesterase CpdA
MSIAIVHISDLHFGGEINPKLTRAKNPSQLAYVTPQGLMPHSLDAAVELELAVRRWLIANRPELCAIAASGDLTLTGHSAEFSVALTYLRSEARVNWSTATGLGTVEACWPSSRPLNPVAPIPLAVPGNHDHWRGDVFATVGNIPRQELHGTYFPPSPSWLRTFESRGIQLQVLGLDSTAGKLHVAARGAVDNQQLSSLRERVARADEDARKKGLVPIRVLMAHHSLSPGRGASGVLHAYNNESLVLLRDFIEDVEVHFVLTGHMHTPTWPPQITSTFGSELRCGTTLQGTRPGREPSTWGHTFFIHDVVRDGDAVLWKLHLFQRLASTLQTPSFEHVCSTVYKLA